MRYVPLPPEGFWANLKERLGVPRNREEHPDRLARFSAEVQSLTFKNDPFKDLQTLFIEVDELVQAEIRYYYRQRVRSRNLSSTLRVVAWVSGTFGVILPIIAASTDGSTQLSTLGSIALAIAAASATANSTFGGTSGHIRYVTSQLHLEELAGRSGIEWAKLKAQWTSAITGSTTNQIEQAFSFISAYFSSAHFIITGETAGWRESILPKEDSPEPGLPGATRQPVTSPSDTPSSD